LALTAIGTSGFAQLIRLADRTSEHRFRGPISGPMACAVPQSVCGYEIEIGFGVYFIVR
jgi:hypothetical protein